MPKASPSSSQVSSAAYARIVEPLGHLDAARPCEPNQHRHGNGERGANGSDRRLAFPERKLPIVFLLWLHCTTCVVKSNHMLDLAERLSIDPSNLSKELRRLEREGLFRSEVSGRQKYFQLNREYPLFDEVRSIVAKTIGAVALITQCLKKMEGIGEAYLYGSFARDQQDTASDLDVLVIGDPREEVLE